MTERKNGLTYADSGVDIDAGNRLVDLIKPMVRATARPGADAEIGGFGGLFDLKAAGFKDPVLVAATDGVGTKLKIAIETGIHSGIGIDLVAMSVNDLVVQGAEPLFFLDYFACGKLHPEATAQIVAGIAEGCWCAYLERSSENCCVVYVFCEKACIAAISSFRRSFTKRCRLSVGIPSNWSETSTTSYAWPHPPDTSATNSVLICPTFSWIAASSSAWVTIVVKWREAPRGAHHHARRLGAVCAAARQVRGKCRAHPRDAQEVRCAGTHPASRPARSTCLSCPR